MRNPICCISFSLSDCSSIGIHMPSSARVTVVCNRISAGNNIFRKRFMCNVLVVDESGCRGVGLSSCRVIKLSSCRFFETYFLIQRILRYAQDDRALEALGKVWLAATPSAKPSLPQFIANHCHSDSPTGGEESTSFNRTSIILCLRFIWILFFVFWNLSSVLA